MGPRSAPSARSREARITQRYRTRLICNPKGLTSSALRSQDERRPDAARPDCPTARPSGCRWGWQWAWPRSIFFSEAFALMHDWRLGLEVGPSQMRWAVGSTRRASDPEAAPLRIALSSDFANVAAGATAPGEP